MGADAGLLVEAGAGVFRLAAGTRPPFAGIVGDGTLAAGAVLTGAEGDRVGGPTGVALAPGAPVAGRGAAAGDEIGTVRGATVDGVPEAGAAVEGAVEEAGGEPFRARVRSLVARGGV